MRIPEVREQLRIVTADIHRMTVALQKWVIVLDELETELYRRPYVRKAATQRTTPRHEHIRAYARTYPDADYMQIAQACGCNTGRVSEALAGYRE